MSTALALQFDVEAEAPSAFALVEAARKARVATASGSGAWDHPRWKLPRTGTSVVRAKKLPGMSALLTHWEPLHAAGRRPGTELRERLVGRWPTGTYEREILDRLLAEAHGTEQGLLVRHELKNLGREADAATNAEQRHFYAVFGAALSDLKTIRSNKDVGFMVHPATLDRAKWTMHELLVFLETHWALRKTHLEMKSLRQRRLDAVRQAAGCLHGPGGFADSHDDLE